MGGRDGTLITGANTMRIVHKLDFDLVTSGLCMPLKVTTLHHPARLQEAIAQAESPVPGPAERGRLKTYSFCSGTLHTCQQT